MSFRLPSSIATFVGVGVLVIVASDFTLGLEGRLEELAIFTYAILPGLAGSVVWISRGSSIWPTFTWTIPVGAVSFVGFLVLAPPFGDIIYMVSWATTGLMLLTYAAPKWWHERVLRFPRSSSGPTVAEPGRPWWAP